MDHEDAIQKAWPLRYDLELGRLREAGEISMQEWSRRFQSLHCATRTEWAIGGLVSQMCTSVDFWTSPDAVEKRTREGAAAIAASELAEIAGEIVDVLCGVFQDDDGWVE